jgi:hypothetical protein
MICDSIDNGGDKNRDNSKTIEVTTEKNLENVAHVSINPYRQKLIMSFNPLVWDRMSQRQRNNTKA